MIPKKLAKEAKRRGLSTSNGSDMLSLAMEMTSDIKTYTRKKKLKLFNGGDGHFFVCAYSWQDCCDLVNSTNRGKWTVGYLRDFWNPGCWGRLMEGTTPVRGVWYQYNPQVKPVKIK